MKYYAVKKGIKPGIYTTWAECEQQVKGFSGAIYKSFSSLDEANAYIGQSDQISGSEADCIAYVDGSYDHSILAYGSGVVLFYQKKKYTYSHMNNDQRYVSMRNVAGEIEASMAAMKFASKHQCHHLEIHYDYEGIEKWCTGEWQAKKEGTQAYRDYYLKKSKEMKITFVKVKSHSGNTLNDEADQLAKKALGLL